MHVTDKEAEKVRRLCKNFEPHEFQCKCCGACNMDEYLLSSLQKLRDILKTPLIINSAYRCPEYNAIVGGKADSQHLYGKAVDVSLTKLPAENRHDFLAMAALYFNGIGVDKKFIHIDVRKPKNFWVY